MKLILQLSVLFVGATAGLVQGQDQIPWAPDYPTACKAAADSNRLVLLHFYSDDCPPCRRVEAEVFTQPQVAAAVAKNYVPVKVHARQAPELARRYHVDRWPTDVIATPAGLEVQRAVSPQTPEQYVAFVDAVAASSGTAARQWVNNMQQVGQATLEQSAASVNRYSTEAQQQWSQASAQVGATADQARQTGLQMSQQAQDAARQAGQQTQAAVQGFRQETQNALEQYRQQAEGAAQFAQQQANSASQQWTNQISATGQQFQQQAAAASNQFQAAAQQFGQQAAPAVGQYGQSVYDQNPAAAAYAASAPNLPTQNPYATAQQGAPPAFAQAPQPQYQVGFQQQPVQPQYQAGYQPQQGAPELAAAGSLAANPPQAPSGLVNASQAPPVAIDGYCPVTLLEKTATNAKDRTAWKKGDPKFGAIHLGRTYLFASEVEQQKFLANPDAYSPVLSGYDPVKYAIGGQLVDGKRSYGITYNRKLFLFADEASRDQFEKSPNAYAQPAYQAMQRNETGGVYR